MPEGRGFAVDLAGDVTALLAPEFQPFFGEDVALVARGVQGQDGTLALDQMSLRTQALSLSGRARLDPDGWPALLDIEGQLASASGAPVRLPSAQAITLGRARFLLEHDAALAEDWRLDLDLTDLTHPTVAMDRAQLSARGALSREGGVVTQATAGLLGATQGMVFADPALGEAAGTVASLSGDLRWQQAAPTRLDNLRLNAAGLVLTGQAALLERTEETAGLPLALDLSAQIDRLARFAALAGQPVSGTAGLDIAGEVDPLAGTFDLRLDGATEALAIGAAQIDPFLLGRTELGLQARRDLQGSFLDALSLRNDQLSLTGTATVYGADSAARAAGQTGAARLSARVNDARPLDPRLAGAVTLEADLTQARDGAWSGLVNATAPQGVTLDAAGRLTGPAPDLAVTLDVPDVSAFATGIAGAARLQGRAFANADVWSLEAQAALPWDLTAQLSGPVTGPAPRLSFEASLPDLTQPVPALADIAPLQTGVSLQGSLTQQDGLWSIDAQTQTGTGIEARVSGPVTGAPDIAFVARVPQLEAFSPALEGRAPLNGAATVSGTIRQDAALWTVDAALQTDGGADATLAGPVTGAAPRLALTARVPDLTQLDPALADLAPLRGAVTAEGTLTRSGDAWSTDLTLAAPSEISARLLGDVAGPGGLDLALAATVPQVQGFVPAIEGTVSLDASLRDTPEGLALAARANGPQNARATAQTVLGEALVADFTLTVPRLAPLAPVPGGLDVTGQARQVAGGFDVSLGGQGPFGAQFTAEIGTAQTLRIATRGQVPDAAALAPQLRGPIDFDVTATQDGPEWRVDATVDGAQALSAGSAGLPPDRRPTSLSRPASAMSPPLRPG